MKAILICEQAREMETGQGTHGEGSVCLVETAKEVHVKFMQYCERLLVRHCWATSRATYPYAGPGHATARLPDAIM